MNLYELTSDLKGIEEQIELLIENNDSTSDEALEVMGEVQLQVKHLIKSKSEGIVKLVRNWDSSIDSIDAEIERLKEFKSKIENKKERLKEYTLTALENADIKKLETSLGNITVRKGTGSVKLINEDLIPEEYKKEKVEIKIDKTAIKNAIKSGESVAGAELVISNSLILPKAK